MIDWRNKMSNPFELEVTLLCTKKELNGILALLRSENNRWKQVVDDIYPNSPVYFSDSVTPDDNEEIYYSYSDRWDKRIK
jgi:hypothetical protein